MINVINFDLFSIGVTFRYLLKKDVNGMLYRDQFDEAQKTLVENTVKFSRLLRTVQENVHASIKKTFAFVWHM